jgi:hypothetical protein
LTHTLHRIGERKSLERDYVIYGLASTVEVSRGNRPTYGNSRELLTRFMEICAEHGPVNMGVIYPSSRPYSRTLAKGRTWKDMRAEMIDYTDNLAVFDDQEKVKRVLKQLKKEDLGLSIVVSGVFDRVFECCRENGLIPHTVNMALGIKGRTELLPEGRTLDVVTMCGHGLVSKYLVDDLVPKVRKGLITAEEAGRRLGANCVCGAFNTKRAAQLLKEIAAEDGEVKG